ncbi:MAG TPA: magnesium transporter MgtE [Bdellovibrionales bacterium]|nr:MAG: hypothetical protein A2Z97_12435 [Bdellovibrionales bacterium GWB1_52_6]OFZ03745.1 MAG: hypothetical protein A2X97_14415 [Bdellovibrionales bacterium GWA1_52_35]OFZ38692.1 MAG: hypothetical protein A2070_13415 [Bdellovibrionales bacterium GWC1_52_8]HAR44295.1 magnesium transporter MgtE [Bdellovibrionales bacterium]HCM38741.1 magnesium transporter MgtE [Bdellovibrionales bacterium]
MTHTTLTRSFSSLYLSNLIGVPVLLQSGERLGTLKDLVINNEERPRVVACIIKSRSARYQGTITLAWEGFAITVEEHRYSLICKQEIPFTIGNTHSQLCRNILDQQIVDVNDKKLVRVNDIRLAFLVTGAYPVAVDVGTSGLLRRLGVVEFTTSLLGVFKRSVPSRLILWSDIEVLSQQSRNIKLSVARSKLLTFHPSDLSDIIEDLDAKTRNALFTSLDHEKAADVLEEMEDDAKVSIVEDLPVEKAADVLEKMPSDEVADILSDLHEDKAEQLLEEMDRATSIEVRELMEYPEDTAGSLMSTDFLTFSPETTIAMVLSELKRLKPDADVLYAIYILDKAQHLLGEVSLRDLVINDPALPLSAIMETKPIAIGDTEHVGSLTRLISKYTLLSVPVIADDRTVLGTIVIDDIIHEIFKNKRVTL